LHPLGINGERIAGLGQKWLGKMEQLDQELDAKDILIEYDSAPLIYSIKKDGEVFLFLMVDDDYERYAYLVVQMAKNVFDQVLANKLPLYDALNQDNMWMFTRWHRQSEGESRGPSVKKVKFADLPEDFLPTPGIFLHYCTSSLPSD
jgi:hypothetical protein